MLFEIHIPQAVFSLVAVQGTSSRAEPVTSSSFPWQEVSERTTVEPWIRVSEVRGDIWTALRKTEKRIKPNWKLKQEISKKLTMAFATKWAKSLSGRIG